MTDRLILSRAVQMVVSVLPVRMSSKSLAYSLLRKESLPETALRMYFSTSTQCSPQATFYILHEPSTLCPQACTKGRKSISEAITYSGATGCCLNQMPVASC